MLGQGGYSKELNHHTHRVPGPRRVPGGKVQPGGGNQMEELPAEQPVTWGEEGCKEEGMSLTSSGWMGWGGEDVGLPGLAGVLAEPGLM